MKKPENSNSRRQFLRNISITGFAIGVSPLVHATTASEIQPQCDPTTLDYYGEGPFYTTNPPNIVNDELAELTEIGTKIVITGRVYNLDCTQYIPNTIIDVWHANNDGAYDNSGYNLRGKTVSNSEGYYRFETIKPGKYLNGSSYRPSHIHFKITAPGFPTVTTQLYFEGDTSIPGDAAASINTGNFDATARIVPLTANSMGILEATWDIIVDGNGVFGVQDLHLDKGMIYSASPNPIQNEVAIKFGVFKSAKISLHVHNALGNVVAILEDKEFTPEKYTSVWTPDSNLAKGIYYISLKVNDFQVHYLKIVRQ